MKSSNDNNNMTRERMIQVLTRAIEKMEAEMAAARPTRKRALLKLIGDGRRRLRELQSRTYH